MMNGKAWLDKVDAWLKEHRQEIIDDLIGLVRIPSVSIPDPQVPPYGQACRDALQYMFDLGRRHGYSSDNYDNYVGAVHFSKGDMSVGLWAHLDVVPVPDPDDWDYPPFDCTVVEDRYMIGRGVQDNKMAAISVLHVMNCLRDLGVKLRHGYSLYMGTAEETGMEDARYFASHYPCPDLSIVPDTGFPVCVAQRGSFTLRVSVPFAAPIVLTHTNNPSVTPEALTAQLPDGRVLRTQSVTSSVTSAMKYPSAVLDMVDLLCAEYPEAAHELQSLRKLCASWDGSALGMAWADEDSGALAMAPTGMLWEDGKLSVNLFGILPITSDVDALAGHAMAAAELCGASCQLMRARRPCAFPTDHPVVKLLTDVYNDVTGYDAKPFVMTGGNYAACLPNAFGFGPGMPGREFPPHIFRSGHGDFHGCDESEDIEHILAFMRVYVMGILALEEYSAE